MGVEIDLKGDPRRRPDVAVVRAEQLCRLRAQLAEHGACHRQRLVERLRRRLRGVRREQRLARRVPADAASGADEDELADPPGARAGPGAGDAPCGSRQKRARAGAPRGQAGSLQARSETCPPRSSSHRACALSWRRRPGATRRLRTTRRKGLPALTSISPHQRPTPTLLIVEHRGSRPLPAPLSVGGGERARRARAVGARARRRTRRRPYSGPGGQLGQPGHRTGVSSPRARHVRGGQPAKGPGAPASAASPSPDSATEVPRCPAEPASPLQRCAAVQPPPEAR